MNERTGRNGNTTMAKLDKGRSKQAGAAWLEAANRDLWAQYDSHREPPLAEVLDDPIVQALAASDHVTRSEIDTLVKIIRDYRSER